MHPTFWRAYDGDEAVGMLWFKLSDTSEGVTAFGYDFSVREDLRRQGCGRALTRAAEVECRELEVVSVALNVFGHSTGAQPLYEQLGFEVTSIQMPRLL